MPDRDHQSGGKPAASERVDIDELCVNTIRTLSMDAVQAAKSGHPGTPMGLAPVAYTVWQQFLRYDPADAFWPNRDRFVLSCGHASMLLYSVLHLAGVKEGHADANAPRGEAVSLDDIKHFRQLDSKCPGHPEYGMTTGVEATTGPLGQGCAMSVGMAIASRWLGQHFNRPGATLFDYDTYVLCSDGDMMEGISGEAASVAAHLKLANLCWIYDSNDISIEGHGSLAFTEDVAARFRAYGWNVQIVSDANDRGALAAALEQFRRTKDAPSFILVHSHIGYGAPKKQDTAAAHGEPLGDDEIRGAKRAYGWPEDAKFLVPEGVQEHFRAGMGQRGRQLHEAWSAQLQPYRAQHPELADQLDRMQRGELPDKWEAALPSFPADAKGVATRESSGKVLNAVAAAYPWMIGGSADLSPSTKTNLTFDGAGEFEAATPGGRNLHFGVREHSMGAIVNGLSLSLLRAYDSTFLIFSDYMKPAIRLSALMELPAIHIFTHDSIGLGEDGPTHQPVEQLIGLRSIPGLVTFRPADANEVAEAWRVIVKLKHQPAALVLSRQPLPTVDRSRYAAASGVARGAYVLADPENGKPQAILMATGSEVALCLQVFEALQQQGIGVRVVSMPSWELFEQQDEAYRQSVLPPQVTARVSVEAASVFGWDRYVGFKGAKIGMRSFGASAPINDLLKKFGFTPDQVQTVVKDQIARNKEQKR